MFYNLSMAYKVNFTSKTLLEYTFQKNVRGYNALEVDRVLDKVIDDLIFYEINFADLSKKVEKLTLKCDKLEEKLKAKELEVANLSNKLPSLKEDKAVSRENVNLLKRIDALERALYKKGVDPSKIS